MTEILCAFLKHAEQAELLALDGAANREGAYVMLPLAPEIAMAILKGRECSPFSLSGVKTFHLLSIWKRSDTGWILRSRELYAVYHDHGRLIISSEIRL